jgi:hypothetical protein
LTPIMIAALKAEARTPALPLRNQAKMILAGQKIPRTQAVWS